MIEPSDVAGLVYRAVTDAVNAPAASPQDRAIMALAGWEAVEREAQANMAAWVQRGRAAGLSWQEVGAALRITRQAAQQRYGRSHS